MQTNKPSKIIIANWKMFGKQTFCQNMFHSMQNNIGNNVKVVICPPYIYIPTCIEYINKYKLKNVEIGAQNLSHSQKINFTGEISAEMLKDNNIKYVIIGHSERRAFCDNNIIIAQKLLNATSKDLVPILCIGDNVEEFKAKSMHNLLEQIDTAFSVLSSTQPYNILVAYEPIWAIGSGLTPSLEEIQNIISSLKKYINEKYKTYRIKAHYLYGGSVNADNIQNILNCEDVEGVLIGGMSIKHEEFCNAIATIN